MGYDHDLDIQMEAHFFGPEWEEEEAARQQAEDVAADFAFDAAREDAAFGRHSRD